MISTKLARFATLLCSSALLAAPIAALAQAASTPAQAPAAAPAAAPAQAPQGQSGPVTLRYKFAAGQIRNYNITIDMSGTVSLNGNSFPLNQHMQMAVSQTVQNVNSDGSATVATHIIGAQMTMNGHQQQYSDAQIQQMQSSTPVVVMSPTGKVLSVAGSGAGGSGVGMPGSSPSQLMQLSQNAALPENPVNVGDTWRGAFDVMNQKFSTRGTLGQVTTGPDGDQMAQIAMKYYGQSMPGGMVMPNLGRLYLLTTGTGTGQFDNTLGIMRTFDSSMSSKVTIEPGATAAPSAPKGPIKTVMNMSMHMELLGNSAKTQ